MAFLRWVLPVAALLLTTACSPSLNSGAHRLSAASLGNSLVHGETTRQEVYHLLGPPQTIIRPSESARPFLSPDAGRHPMFPDAEIWTYSGRRIAQARALDPRPMVHQHTTLRLFFDQNGVLLDYFLLEMHN
ncbi:hypothetical protein [Geoalkalibacter halelectricus]|uniref:SmpA / OmlA family protein n=1 Tax=Geoalkalibacter halelectricus TaxID=2847045 RepID=A0ABY5ZJH2_9BACT|nr:hypothetical protein [Geoalkalibacter halelectricus]MDO3379539.1 hypothetical protein [Geoalkalibacter halelectricus]UWZ78127.1 hypothetical protein L9S41_10495 [Geoalkalibacter halelectricus]